MPDSNLPAQFDVLVVGGGAAGLYAALCLPPNLKVGLISKESLSLSASDWAQGGIAAAIAPDDSPELHLRDTLKAGAGLCDPDAVRFLVEEAPDCVRSLLQMGVEFDQHNGHLAMTLEAAHSRRRVLHAADTTGRAIVATLKQQVFQRPNIKVIAQACVLDLWMTPNAECRGVCLVYQAQLHWLQARATILATGGGGQVFAHTTNPALSTGDGVAMAWRSGTVLRDLEFFQFHPTALCQPGAPRFLISEAVRGEGAHLIDAQGRRFAFDYHPDGELAPRDVVSRAIFCYLSETSENPAQANVWLDLLPIPTATIRHRFPNILQVCQQWGIDGITEPIPVAPAAHYWMGGVMTDTRSQTSISGLYAVGETASTGVHGANRLASNSLLECLVFGRQLNQIELLPEAIAPLSPPFSLSERSPISLEKLPTLLTRIKAIRDQLPALIWQSAGICREQRSMDHAIVQVQDWQQELTELEQAPRRMIPAWVQHLTEAEMKLWGETRNLVDIAALILCAARFRTESRGGHYRSDYPETRPEWQTHTLIQGDRIEQSERVP